MKKSVKSKDVSKNHDNRSQKVKHKYEKPNLVRMKGLSVASGTCDAVGSMAAP